MNIRSITKKDFLTSGLYTKILGAWDNISQVDSKFYLSVYGMKQGSGASSFDAEPVMRDVLTPLEKGKDWLFALTAKHQPRAAELLLNGGELFVRLTSSGPGISVDLAVEVNNKIVIINRNKWGWNLSDPGHGSLVNQINDNLSVREGQCVELNWRQYSLPITLREAYYTRFDGISLPDSIQTYPERILPWSTYRPWQSSENYLKSVRGYKKEIYGLVRGTLTSRKNSRAKRCTFHGFP